MASNIPKPEYPRPQMVRKEWFNLNGIWDFAWDDEDKGKQEKWYQQHLFTQKITVPFAYQSKASGIGETQIHDIVWYQKRVEGIEIESDKKYILHFGAVDYQTQLWVNGLYVGTHQGGHTSFSFDVTEFLKQDTNTITLRVEDESKNLELPRGKQFWKETSEGIFYTRTTGIWQTVWLEPVSRSYLKKVWMTPDVDRKMIRMEFEVEQTKSVVLQVEISFKDQNMIKDTLEITHNKTLREYYLDQNINLEWEHKSYEWTPENPVLFKVQFTLLEENAIQDEVQSYFAMRKVSIENGKFLLNNRPYYQKMLLDQGYWRDSLMTAPDDEALKRDIELCKEMGFNGVRKHQKIEEERYFYWADTLGFLVWSECANAYLYSKRYVERMLPEWIEAVSRDYNHPCIVAWVPLNESWGVDNIMHSEEEQAHATSMYYLTKSLDITRPVISNDGWNHTKSDLLTIHDYECRGEQLKKRYTSLESILQSMPTNRTLFAKGFQHEGQPIIVSEFGGIAYQKSSDTGWGYANASNEEEFLKNYSDVINALQSSPLVQGFVYTQLYDVEQEINGLLTYDREPKVALEAIRKIMMETSDKKFC